MEEVQAVVIQVAVQRPAEEEAVEEGEMEKNMWYILRLQDLGEEVGLKEEFSVEQVLVLQEVEAEVPSPTEQENYLPPVEEVVEA